MDDIQKNNQEQKRKYLHEIELCNEQIKQKEELTNKQ